MRILKVIWQIAVPILSYLLISLMVGFGGIMLGSFMLSEDSFWGEFYIKNSDMLVLACSAVITSFFLKPFYDLDWKWRNLLCQRQEEGVLYRIPLLANGIVTLKKIPSTTELLGLAIGIALSGNAALELSGLNKIFTGGTEVMQNFLKADAWLVILTTVVLAPLVEELIYRGLVYRRLRDYMSFKMAAFLSALLFAVIHGNVTQGCYAMFAGFLFAWIYERYNSLQAAWMAHVFANAASLFLAGLFLRSVSGCVIALIAGGLMTVLNFLRIAKKVAHEDIVCQMP